MINLSEIKEKASKKLKKAKEGTSKTVSKMKAKSQQIIEAINEPVIVEEDEQITVIRDEDNNDLTDKVSLALSNLPEADKKFLTIEEYPDYVSVKGSNAGGRKPFEIILKAEEPLEVKESSAANDGKVSIREAKVVGVLNSDIHEE